MEWIEKQIQVLNCNGYMRAQQSHIDKGQSNAVVQIVLPKYAIKFLL